MIEPTAAPSPDAVDAEFELHREIYSITGLALSDYAVGVDAASCRFPLWSNEH
jgi:hypothetical protein